MDKYTNSLRGPFFEQLNGDIGNVPVRSIGVEKRQRPIDKVKVNDLITSIENEGLLQPIGIRRARDGESGAYFLVYGAHRLEAWRTLLDASDEVENLQRWDTIPSVIYPRACSEDMALLLELTENTNRKGLTTSDHKRMCSQVLKLRNSMVKGKGTKRNEVAKSQVATWSPPSYKEAASDSNIPTRTLQYWYKGYKDAHHGKNWNKQTEAEYLAFLDYLHKEANAEERKKEADRVKALDKTRDKAKAEFKQAIEGYIEQFGRDEILEWISEV